MFKHILVPVDLSEKDKLKRAIEVATDQAKHFEAKLTLVSVVGGLQARVSNSPAKYAGLLAEFAESVSATYGVNVDSNIYEVPDPSVQLDGKLLKIIEETGIDLIIMASHQPGWAEYLINSHGGRVASHAPISVFVVRDPR